MADFLSPRIRARARAIQAINPSIEDTHDSTPLSRSHSGSHKRKSSSVESQAHSGYVDTSTPDNLASLFEIQPRYEVWRRWTLTLLLLFFSAGLAALILEYTVHAVLRAGTQPSTAPEIQPPDPTPSSTNVTVPERAFAQGEFAFGLWDSGNSTRGEGAHTLEGSAKPMGTRSVEKSMKEPLRRYPTIDRSILAKFGGLDPNGLPGERELDDAQDTSEELEELPEPLDTSRRWPAILHIPEGRASLRGSPKKPSSSSSQAAFQEPPNICGPAHPSHRACRFLFPLRMAEQESKARIHFTQVAQLARRLNRILVLPNVGKSRMGACYKYAFETYYDVAPFFGGRSASTLDAESGDAGYVRLDDFRLWSEAQKKPIRSRLLSVAASVAQEVLDSAVGEPQEDTETVDLVIHRYPTELARETEFPGCFPSKWTQLELEDTSVFVALDSQNPSTVSPLEFGDLLAKNIDSTPPFPDETLPTHPNQFQEPLQPPNPNPTDPDVLILNWDLRRPIFPPDALSDVSLQYSPALQDLATKLAPGSPYLAIHWRMETVDVGVLGDCAHALVGVISDILHDTGHLGLGVRRVWFASDYPYPLASSTSENSSEPTVSGKVAKSGTFKTFGEQHEDAVGILTKAFEGGGDLEGWEVVDISMAISQGHGEDPAHYHESEIGNGDLLKDTGVLGILDKMVVSRANLFVSGSRGCSRYSSFTRQVVESRQANWKDLRNVVSVF